jgi:hypothetical protein
VATRSNVNWGEILQKSVTKPEVFGAAKEIEKPKKKKNKGKKTKKKKKTKTPAAEEGSYGRFKAQIV